MKRLILFNILLGIAVGLLLPLNILASVHNEDFTTYTEVDSNDHIAVTANHIDFDAYANEDAYLYDDKGVDYFGDFEHRIDIKPVSYSDNDIQVNVMLLSNDIDDAYGLHFYNKTFIAITVYRIDTGFGNRISLEENYNFTLHKDYCAASFGTWYYLTVNKAGTDLSCKIYSDSARTTLLDTLNLTLHADHHFRYIFPATTWNFAPYDWHLDIDIENLNLGVAEEAPSIVTNNATYISRTTARLNSYLVGDGGEACDVRFQYSIFSGGSSGGGTENFSNYTEVDPNGHITYNDTHIVSNLTRPEVAYLYDDKGVGYFTDFTHRIEANATWGSDWGHNTIWMVADAINCTDALKSSDETGIYVYFYDDSSNLQIALSEVYGTSIYTDTYTPASYDTTYYFLNKKTGTTMQTGIYSSSVLRDAGNATDGDVDNLNLILHADHSLQYVYGTSSLCSGVSGEINATIANFTTLGGAWTSTPWVNDTYTTGDAPYANIVGLDMDTQYFFRVQARNTLGIVNGNELNFTTYPTIFEPTNFTGYPDATTISLTWTKGVNAANTMIRGQAGAYPANYTDGKQVYAGTMATVTDTNLSPGTTYYYRSWSYDGVGYTANYTDYLMTTSAYANVTTETPAEPTTPSNWWGIPDYTNLQNIAGYGLINTIADNFEIPRNTFWMSLILILIMSIGLFIYSVQHNVTVALILMSVMIVIAAVAHLLPLFLLAIIGIPVAGIMLVKRRI